MERVRVCFFSLGAYPMFSHGVTGAGGAEVQIALSALALARDERYDVTVIVGPYGQPEVEVRHGVTLRSFERPRGGLKLTRPVRMHLRLWSLMRTVDAHLFVARTAGPVNLSMALFCRLLNRKFVYMVAHDEDLGRKVPDWFGSGLTGRVKWTLFRLGLRWSHLVVVQHRGQLEELRRAYGKKGVIRPSAHPVPERPPPYGERSFVLWTARCEPWKRPEALLSLARELPEEKFVMICPPSVDRSYYEAVRSEAAALPNVEFLSSVPHREMERYYLRARVFVNTSRKEGFPNTFVEAAGMGTPVLSLSVDPDSVLGRFGFGRCFDGDLAGMVRFLRETRGSRHILEGMAENSWRYASEHHDLEKIVEEDKRVFLDLLRPRR